MDPRCSIVLVHAIADSALFRASPSAPANSIHAIAITQRGHGDASRPAEGYRPHDFVEDLAAFMDVLHLEEAIIAGGSSGALSPAFCD